MAQVYMKDKDVVTDFAYAYVETSTGALRKLTKAQLIALLGSSSGSSGGSYTLPAATADALGGVKADTKGTGDTVPAKIGSDNKLYVPTYPTELKNPKALTIKIGSTTYTYDGSGAVTVSVEASGGGTAEIARIEKASTDTTVELQPNTLYVFPEMATLTLTLAAAADTGVVSEYHVVFQSGATATTLTIPDTVKVPSGFTVEANKVYELSIMESCLTAQSWAVS